MANVGLPAAVGIFNRVVSAMSTLLLLIVKISIEPLLRAKLSELSN
jgi:hypothetical protein